MIHLTILLWLDGFGVWICHILISINFNITIINRIMIKFYYKRYGKRGMCFFSVKIIGEEVGYLK